MVRVQKEPDDTVMTWPHLLSIEFLAAGMMSIFLLLMGLFVNAPLEALANGNVTPAVAKAPWYFLGLQELLAYFHPTVAGALTPVFVLVGAALIPYVDRGDLLAFRPSQRKTAVMLFTLFCALGRRRRLHRVFCGALATLFASCSSTRLGSPSTSASMDPRDDE